MSINHLQMMSQPQGTMPYQQPVVLQPQVQANQNKIYMVWVQGIEGAKAYLLSPGTTIPLWDSENQCVYIKSSDQNGVPRPLTIIDYTIRQSEPVCDVSASDSIETSDFASKEDLSSIEEKLSSLTALVEGLTNRLDRRTHLKKGGKPNEQ